MKALRAAVRLGLLAGLVLGSLPSGFAAAMPGQRARWMHRLAGRILAIMGARVVVCGEIPREGLVVSNHLGYLDVLAIGSIKPAVFVAKSEVREWPVVGWLCRLAGSIFVERQRRLAVGKALMQIRRPNQAGLPVVLFPEGTSTDGSTLLPFKSSLLEAFVDGPATAAAITYHLAEGSVADELCYWREMTFGPHFWNVLGKRGFGVEIHFGSGRLASGDRKSLARDLRDDVLALRERSAESPALGRIKESTTPARTGILPPAC